TRPPRPRGAHSRRQYPARTLSDTRGPRWRNGGPAKSSSRDQLRPKLTPTGLVSAAALLRQIGIAFAHTRTIHRRAARSGRLTGNAHREAVLDWRERRVSGGVRIGGNMNKPA